MSERETPAQRIGERWGQPNTAGVAIASSLAFEGVTHAYGARMVVEDITVRVDAGKVLCLLGPSGSGKTTLLRIAAGIEEPQSGAVLIDGRLVSGRGRHVPPEARGVGLVFQDYALFPHLTVLDNVRFGLRGVERRAAIAEAMRLLERVGMHGHAHAYPHHLSGGEQQRVALARALAPRPGILLMDEPFSGLDARLRDTIRDETVSLLRDTRSTAVIVTHDPEEALRVGDSIALMRKGKMVQFGSGEDLYLRPADLFAARFFSELNLFESRVVAGLAHTPIGPAAAAPALEGQPVTVGVRLADVSVVPSDAAAFAGKRAGEDRLLAQGRVVGRRFVGIADLIELRVNGCDEIVRARLRAGELPAGTRDVGVRISPGAALVFPRG